MCNPDAMPRTSRRRSISSTAISSSWSSLVTCRSIYSAAMTDIQRPPRDITPKEFFESWLPAQAGAVAPPARPMTVRVRLDGEGGGSWDLELGPGGLVVTTEATGSGEPEVTVAQSTAAWPAIGPREPRAAPPAPPPARAARCPFPAAAPQKGPPGGKGPARFGGAGPHGPPWSMTVKPGGRPFDASRPDATITVDAETYGQMLARTLPAPAAYFQGKIR